MWVSPLPEEDVPALAELIGDLDQTMLSGVIVAAALAAVVEHSIMGTNPVFHVQGNYTLDKYSSLVWYALLGLLAAILGQREANLTNKHGIGSFLSTSPSVKWGR